MRRCLNQKIETYLFAILTFLIPIVPKLVPLVIIILVATILFRLLSMKGTNQTFKVSFLPQDIMAILFLMYLIGMTYSSNQHFGWKDVEAKLSFVIFPIVFAIMRFKQIRVNIHFILIFFVLGCFISSLLNIYEGFYCYLTTDKATCFLSSSLTYNAHINHISIYYGATIISLIYLRIPKWIKTFLILWFTLFIIVFLSLGAYIALFFGVVFFIFLQRKKIKHFSLKLISVAVLAIIVGISIYYEISSNYDQMYKGINSKEELYFRANRYSESLLNRIVVWDVALNELIDHPFGVGTGDVKDELIDHYRKSGLTKIERQKLNPHNQYLQTGVSIGFLGILSLISLFILTLKKSLKDNNTNLAVFVIVVMTNMLFESYLEIQAGIVFTSLFLYLFDLFKIQNKQFDIKVSD